MSDFGENISTLRASLGLSRAAFGDALGVKADKVKHIETGFQRADHEFLAALRAKFGVDLNAIIDGGADTAILPDSKQDEEIVSLPVPDFIPVTRFTVEASAGHGSLVQDETGSGTYAYNRAFLDRRGLRPENLAVISVKGDSMEPDLSDGDLILIDRAEAQPDAIKEGRIYVVNFDGDLYVKRIQRAPGRRLMLVSSNPVYHPVMVDEGQMDGVKIIGRVVNSTHEW